MDSKSSKPRRLRRLFHALEWPLLLALTVLAVTLGFWGFRQHSASIGETRSAIDCFYLTLQLFVLESGAVSGAVPWALQIARFLAPLVAVYAAGKALAVVFREQLQQLRYRFRKGHVVICGAGRKGVLLTKAFVQRGDSVVVLEKSEGADTVSSAEEAGAKVLIGDAAEEAHLRRAGITRARYLISVCGDDGTNAEVALRARHLNASRTGEPLSCAAHLFDPELFRLLREQWFATQDEENFRLEFFNIFDRGARALLEQHSPFSNDQKASEPPHILVVGMGRLGESLVVQMARRWWHLPGDRGDLSITVIDRAAESKAASICSRYPGLEGSCRLDFFDVEFPSAAFEKMNLEDFGGERLPVTRAYVCFDNDSLSLSAALSLHERLRADAVPVVARMQEDAGLATLLRGEGLAGSKFENLNGFGLLDSTWTIEVVLSGAMETLARALHENYRTNREAEGETERENPSLVAWEKLPEDMRQSNRRQAMAVRKELAKAGCRLEPQRDWREVPIKFSRNEKDLLARIEHDRWYADRLAGGWQIGPEKDLDSKTHPLLEPWEKLEEDTRERAREDMSSLSVALAEVGFAIRRNGPERRNR
jgi:hypothetical protein